MSVNSYEIIILNGWLGDKYTEFELRELDSMTIPGTATVPYRQRTLLFVEFAPPINGMEDVLSGNAKFTCLTNDSKSITFDLNLFGKFGESILAAEI